MTTSMGYLVRSHHICQLWLLLVCCSWNAHGWVTQTPTTFTRLGLESRQSEPFQDSHRQVVAGRPTSRTSLAAGFGGGDNKKRKETKLKPKQQWDRFLDLKKEAKFRVAIRTSDDTEWLEVGNVKSKENQYTEIALARQRALVAEHARRLFPLQISAKDTVTWAFWNEEADEWTIVDKSILDETNAPANAEKLIGFEGRPDPATGFYCVYNEGRLVNDSDDVRPSSKKLK